VDGQPVPLTVDWLICASSLVMLDSARQKLARTWLCGSCGHMLPRRRPGTYYRASAPAPLVAPSSASILPYCRRTACAADRSPARSCSWMSSRQVLSR
jgi:hypothetical protein